MLCVQNVCVRPILIYLNPILTEFVMMLVSPPHRHPFDDLSSIKLNKGLTTYDFYNLRTITKSVFILANSADPDETMLFAVSHLGLRCLYMFPL